ncbi:Uncharacterized protein TCAP_03317 [Tolypocladium capitatum]|uniref:DUF3824 domain-containing protein n=1 Tax=Tolypocladium capitatum TaxID=45235 RepID=A0A2K3QGW5_9HYPO|nr:Uncharacterized protein TCAP_03317 [Tolypocladium capitatum]
MGDAYRGSRLYRDRDSDSEDDRYRSTTVTRYKVTPGRGGVERYERSDRIDVDDDRRSRFSGRASVDFFNDRRGPLSPARPRSAFEPYRGDRSRTVYYERDVERDAREWDRRPHHGRHDDEIKVEKKVAEERFDDDHGHEVDRYRKETEYFGQTDPPPAPVIIRQQGPEPQKIIVQEAPPAPIIIPRQQPSVVVVRDREQDREMVRRDRDPYNDEYYYRHERRDVGPYRGDRDYAAVSRYDRRRRDDDYYSDDDDYYVRRRTVARRERSESPHHKRHLAEGALAGAGITALMSSRRDEYGDLPENRGQKVLAGAALGALGTEALHRAHSAFEDRWRDGRESPDHHYMLKKGLGIAAVALAAAGAAKYYQASKVDKEEAHRGRSRTRGYHSGEDYSRSRSRVSRSRTRSRRRSISTAAKAALGTAATAGIIKHFRDKSKSKSRHGSRSRSKSTLRRGAEIAGAAAAAGAASKLWKNHKDKKEARDYSPSDDERDHHHRSRSRGGSRDRGVSKDRGMSRTRSRSRSTARSPHSPSRADPELGLVEYGNAPLPSEPSSSAARQHESGTEAEDRRRRRRRRRDRSGSSSPSDHERKRSKSRLRDMAAAGAAAFGIKEFMDRKDQGKREKRSRERRSRERGQEERRDDDERRHDDRRHDDRRHDDRRHDDRGQDGYLDDHNHRPHSPPTASGGAYYPPYPSTPGPTPPGERNYAPYPEASDGPPREYQPYMPQDYMGYVPPPPPDGVNPNYPYRASSSRGPPTASKSVSFIPLSPKSSQTMEMHRRKQAAATEGEDPQPGGEHDEALVRPVFHRRRSSDPSADRPVRRRDAGNSDSDENVESLPDRFDSEGQPLDGRSASHHRWATRRGTFERPPRRPGDWDVRGAWQVSGTEGEAVDRLVRNVTGALEGQRSWMSVIGDVIGGGLLPPGDGQGDGHANDDGRAHEDDDRRHRMQR